MKLLGAFAKMRKCTISFVISVCPSVRPSAWNNWVPTGWIFIKFENRAFYVIMWKNIVEPDWPQMTIWRMRITCWIPEATNTH